VGAGAAGCACALSLASGTKALLIDMRQHCDGRCCGGLLAPDAQAALGRLGFELPSGVRVEPEPRIVHVLDLESGREQNYTRNYWNIDRAGFDAWLLELASSKAELRPGTRLVGVDWQREGFHARIRHKDRIETVQARCLVGAEGARSLVRRRFFPAIPKPDLLHALQVGLPPSDSLRAHEVIFSSELTDFYAWAIPKPDCVLVGSAFADPATARPRFDKLVQVMCSNCGLSNEVLSRSARPLSRPRTRDHLLHGGAGILLTGEAAGLVSPSSGEGISYAVESGTAAGRAFGSKDPARAYISDFDRIASKVCGKFLKARTIFTPWARRLAMRLPWCP
jgi:geranylgeranyl reductase